MRNLVSIIIPTYNRAKSLESTIESIVNQTYRNIEIMIIDDGSTDETCSLVKKLKIKYADSNIIYDFQSNSGAPRARNRGVGLSKGDYVVFFDSDDVMHNERIEKQLTKILSESTDICAAGFEYSNSGIQYLPPEVCDNAIELFLRNKLYGSTQSWMYSKKIITDIEGYDTDLVCSQDLDLTFRVLTKFPKISILKEVLTLFNEHNFDVRVSNNGIGKKGMSSVFRTHMKRVDFLVIQDVRLLNYLEMKDLMSLISRNIKIGNFRIIKNVLKESYRLISNKTRYQQLLYFVYLLNIEIIKGFLKKTLTR